MKLGATHVAVIRAATVDQRMLIERDLIAAPKAVLKEKLASLGASFVNRP